MMSKQISRFLAVVAVVTLPTMALLIPHSAAQRASVANSAARNAAIVAATSEVLKETSEIRELPILRPVKSSAQSRTEIERMLIKGLDEQMTAAEMHATEVSLRKFGLAPNDFEYRSFIIKLLTEQVAGYYDPKVQQFHLADWLELESQKPVMAHELTHALQDQHFNLRRFEKWPHGDSDAELAAHALIEGDATLAMTIYMAKNPLVALAFSRSLTSGVATEQFNQAPRAMRESLIFPTCTVWSGRRNSTDAAVGLWSQTPLRDCRCRANRFFIRKNISTMNDRSRSCCQTLRICLTPVVALSNLLGPRASRPPWFAQRVPGEELV